jgi:SAM-dependent methyltransferase
VEIDVVTSPSKSLDLGCGPIPRNPYGANHVFGIDLVGEETDFLKIADLVIQPIPFEDSSIDFVTAYDFLEHVPRLTYVNGIRIHPFIELMNEIHRVLKPGGVFLAHTPAYPKQEAFQDPTHVNIISENTIQYFAGHSIEVCRSYGFRGEFEIIKQEWAEDFTYWLIWEIRKLDKAIDYSKGNRNEL